MVLVGGELKAWSVEESCGSCWGGVGGMGERSVEESCGSCWGGVGGMECGGELWFLLELLSEIRI